MPVHHASPAFSTALVCAAPSASAPSPVAQTDFERLAETLCSGTLTRDDFLEALLARSPNGQSFLGMTATQAGGLDRLLEGFSLLGDLFHRQLLGEADVVRLLQATLDRPDEQGQRAMSHAQLADMAADQLGAFASLLSVLVHDSVISHKTGRLMLFGEGREQTRFQQTKALAERSEFSYLHLRLAGLPRELLAPAPRQEGSTTRRPWMSRVSEAFHGLVQRRSDQTRPPPIA